MTSSPLATGQTSSPRMSKSLQNTPPPFSHMPNSDHFNHPFSSMRSPGSPSSLRRSSPLASNMPFRSPPVGSSSIFPQRRRFSEHNLGVGMSNSGMRTSSFGSLVGSYEESLLNGRMSTLPSKPLIFDAELGVLGLGKCKASLRCPPHINFKFPAHFYNLEGVAGKEGKASPSSPYVGTIDLDTYYMDRLLDTGLESLDLGEDEAESSAKMDGLMMKSQAMCPSSPSKGLPFARRTLPRPAKQSKKPHFPGYRVPAKGQIQLVIKNPNLTAVKVFLVPYDLTDMPAGTKTFVRQKCHAASPTTPLLDSNATFQSVPNGSPIATTSNRAPASAKETLRYAVHLQFCAVQAPVKPGKAGFEGVRRSKRDVNGDKIDVDQGTGSRSTSKSEPRIYLHKSIRVVFSARVPDKSEKLTNATETPRGAQGEGMYSTYNGPSEEWKYARQTAKERIFASRRYDQDDQSAAFIINSDPNGERWEGGDMELDESNMDQEQINGVEITPRSSQDRMTEDRALLENWHASLASRPTLMRRISSQTSITHSSQKSLSSGRGPTSMD
ncbi:uncharacterized protein FA14DRAFT_170231 [Meira miltonrushii]|uniref:Atos-like conserved domain-containing protein n=1 Tax=Meira miltonrushii TaxID=1280837 RepID=A0A316VPC6_9BASI|nr:uncharacterized protein FA14DRAFT_170231 [Meira miltonrushii]PWN37375.1 hypothetical protein FA14DRAFT_170231 [Meira miltonrushii]